MLIGVVTDQTEYCCGRAMVIKNKATIDRAKPPRGAYRGDDAFILMCEMPSPIILKEVLECTKCRAVREK